MSMFTEIFMSMFDVHVYYVYFAVEPEINLPNQRMGQFVGKDTVLECVVSAYPQAVTMWKFRGQPITNSDKYGVDDQS